MPAKQRQKRRSLNAIHLCDTRERRLGESQVASWIFEKLLV